MSELKEMFQSADWSKEKHVPVIECADTVKKGDIAKVLLSVGKAIPHPNTTEHHIRWIDLYFLADGEKFPYQVAKSEFAAHGESTQGPNTGTVFASPEVTVAFKTDKSGTIMASSYCNIHGLWSSSRRIEVK
ncbi:MAG: class II SORL domain-containing protein [Candidatus Omnitrophica bacterium]|nr:class II SORL domain-containing protein [Candidatus Omnitrophota bacterium]